MNVKDCISLKIDELRPKIIDFLQQLVQQRSLPGEEQSVQSLIADKHAALGMSVNILKSERSELEGHPAYSDDGIFFKDRVNVVATWIGQGVRPERTLILNGHVDVVPAGSETLWARPPWAGIVESGRLYGRGSCDMKSGVTSAIFACQALRELGFAPESSVSIETVIGEESGGVGTLTTLMKGIRAAAVIIMEPTRLQICPMQSGALSFRLKVSGRAIHASMKAYGVSAIEKFFIIFQALEQFDRDRHSRYHNSLFENPKNIAPISIGTLRCGDWPSTVPDELVAEGRFGIFPGEQLSEARKEFEFCLQNASASDGWLSEHPAELEWFEGQFEPSVTSMDEPIAQCLSNCHKSILGERPGVHAVPYGSDQRLFTNHGNMPAILYGPGDVALAHTVEEYVDLEEVFTCAKVLALTIVDWCGGSFPPVARPEVP